MNREIRKTQWCQRYEQWVVGIRLDENNPEPEVLKIDSYMSIEDLPDIRCQFISGPYCNEAKANEALAKYMDEKAVYVVFIRNDKKIDYRKTCKLSFAGSATNVGEKLKIICDTEEEAVRYVEKLKVENEEKEIVPIIEIA